MNSRGMYTKTRINGVVEDVFIELIDGEIIFHVRENADMTNWFRAVTIKYDYTAVESDYMRGATEVGASITPDFCRMSQRGSKSLKIKG